MLEATLVEERQNTEGSFQWAALRKFVGGYGRAANDRLLICFAGHGAAIETEGGRDLGYVAPCDVPPPANKGAFKQAAVSMESFQNLAKQIESRPRSSPSTVASPARSSARRCAPCRTTS